MLALSLPAFAVSCWLGFYLLARDVRKPLLRRTAAGLLGFAAAIAFTDLPFVATALLGVPALAWTGVLLRLPAGGPPSKLDTWWRFGYVPAIVIGLIGTAALGRHEAQLVVFGVLAVGLLLGFGRMLRDSRSSPLRAAGLVWLATVLFGLGTASLLLGLDLLPSTLLIAGIWLDLVVLGGLIAWYDALDEGQLLRPDMVRSAVSAGLMAVVFGGQVALVMAVGPGVSASLTALLYGSVAAAIAVQVLAGPVHRALDRLTLSEPVSAERAELRDAIESLPRRGPLADVDDAQFATLTRRALSNYADLGRLVSSPLTALPVIDERLDAGVATDLPLERAVVLKSVLREAIERLKPQGEFGTSDEWRHYNSLYFIYVVGLRPYSQRARHDGLTPEAKKALVWFQTVVPQRSLHNWQNAAARLIADTLR